jgi:hypothetical protein
MIGLDDLKHLIRTPSSRLTNQFAGAKLENAVLSDGMSSPCLKGNLTRHPITRFEVWVNLAHEAIILAKRDSFWEISVNSTRSKE